MLSFNTNLSSYGNQLGTRNEKLLFTDGDTSLSKEEKESFENFLHKAYYYGDPELEMLDGSILHRIINGTLSKLEGEMLNDLESDGEYIPSSLSYLDINKEKYTLMKTMTNVVDFVKLWRGIKEERKKEFFDEFGVKEIDPMKYLKDKKLNYEDNSDNNPNSSTQENNPKDTFTPIQAESKNKETYTSRDNINKSFFLKFIENEREKGNDVLELLENLFKVDKNKVDLKA